MPTPQQHKHTRERNHTCCRYEDIVPAIWVAVDGLTVKDHVSRTSNQQVQSLSIKSIDSRRRRGRRGKGAIDQQCGDPWKPEKRSEKEERKEREKRREERPRQALGEGLKTDSFELERVRCSTTPILQVLTFLPPSKFPLLAVHAFLPPARIQLIGTPLFPSPSWPLTFLLVRGISKDRCCPDAWFEPLLYVVRCAVSPFPSLARPRFWNPVSSVMIGRRHAMHGLLIEKDVVLMNNHRVSKPFLAALASHSRWISDHNLNLNQSQAQTQTQTPNPMSGSGALSHTY